MHDQQQFLDKVVLVTGASGGIGEAAAKAFANQGAKVVLADIDSQGQQVAKDINDLGHSAVFQHCDVSSAVSVKALFDFIEDTYGRLDVAFNNAGIDIESSRLAEGDEATYDKIMDINVKGVWLCMRQAITIMLKTGGGSIVNTASVAGLGAAPKMSIYAASKHALHGLFESLGSELKDEGVHCLMVCPSFIQAPPEAVNASSEKNSIYQNKKTVGKTVSAEKIANDIWS